MNNKKRAVVIIIALSFLLLFVVRLLMPMSTENSFTLNPVSVWYYGRRAAGGDPSAITPLCNHYIFGKRKNLETAEYWVEELAKHVDRYQRRGERFQLMIETFKENDVKKAKAFGGQDEVGH